MHELGHYIAYRSKKIKPKLGLNWEKKKYLSYPTSIYIGTGKQFNKLDISDKMFNLSLGIALGFIPVIIGTFTGVWFVIPLILYLAGCTNDTKILLKLMEEHKKLLLTYYKDK